jgi:hypothetical protein
VILLKWSVSELPLEIDAMTVAVEGPSLSSPPVHHSLGLNFDDGPVGTGAIVTETLAGHESAGRGDMYAQARLSELRQ